MESTFFILVKMDLVVCYHQFFKTFWPLYIHDCIRIGNIARTYRPEDAFFDNFPINQCFGYHMNLNYTSFVEMLTNVGYV